VTFPCASDKMTVKRCSNHLALEDKPIPESFSNLFESINKMFGRKENPDGLIEKSARLVEKAFIEAATETLGREKGPLEHLLTSVLPGVSAALAGNLVMHLVNFVLHALVTQEHSSEIQRSLQKLIANPMRTGIDQLRIAMELEKGIGKEAAQEDAYRFERYKDALRSFDKALANASDDEKIPIHLYRAMASERIPGGVREARIHFARFQEGCNLRANAFAREAEKEANLAIKYRKEADAINLSRGYRGSGGGLIGMSEAVNPNRKMELQVQAQKHEIRAEELRAKSQRFRNCAQVIGFCASSSS
jgi:hypothetical protein